MFYDSHAHYDGFLAEGEAEAVVRRAEEAGVGRVMAVGGSDSLNAAALEMARRFPGRLAASLGFDREHATGSDPEGAAAFAARLGGLIESGSAEANPVRAVGEIGLDYHYHPETADEQVDLFRAQLDVARERGLPVIVHSRDADDATLAALRDHRLAWRHGAEGVGVLHCFTRDAAFARELWELDYYISFSGIVTFRNADPLRAVARVVPDNRLLIETDSPYLAPVPMRGKKNEPAFVRHVAEVLADVRGTSVEQVAALTRANALRLFGA